MVSPLVSPGFGPSQSTRDSELKSILQNIPFTLNTISSNLHNSKLVEDVYTQLSKRDPILQFRLNPAGSPPPTPHPQNEQSFDIRAHKRQKSEIDEQTAAKWALAEDIHRILLSSVQAGYAETTRHSALRIPDSRLAVTTPVSATSEPLRDLPRRNSHRPWEDVPVGSNGRPSFPVLEALMGHKRKFSDDDGLRQLSAVAAAQPVPELGKERLETPEDDNYTHSGKSHKCPYYARDKTGRTHAKCANRTFPNPRKLKEHVWQTTRPYKCSTCLFGFGRDKTRAIHVKERKKGCKPPPPGSALLRESYENSPEHIRDQRIEAARSTEEIVEILNDYDKAKGPDARDTQSYEEEESEVGSQEDDSTYQKMKFPEDFSQSQGLRLPSIRSHPSPVQSIFTPAHSRTNSQTRISLSPQSPVHREIFNKSELTLPPLQIREIEQWHGIPRFCGILSN